ncbi:uncharacterized protein EDB93DRAFT_1096754 [Suillus bovinus]|uniref:uncharacterized protein n=1 Tax=Suillus bovinus TaxID=48563 RepID=UPI001B884F81|nr:uncharacterized protein EDB93DRAFT_1096754 [Suillus bovinus]KAG2127158.1 hypothetical protein EDB93DRAFT_1096754 [Suillus bovinus]
MWTWQINLASGVVHSPGVLLLTTNFNVAKQIYPDLPTDQIGEPELITHIQQILHDQLHHSDSSSEASKSTGSFSALPELYENITLYTSAIATFFAPSDVSGIGGMCYE